MKRLPTILIVLLSAMLIGLVGHGFEIFEKVEGRDWIGAVKAFGFPLALEVGNAAGLFVLASPLTKGWYTRLIGGVIGLICLVFSFLIQYNYYRLKIDFDLLYSFALPTLAALIAILIGFLDKDNTVLTNINPTTPDLDYDQNLVNELRQTLENYAKTQEDLKVLLDDMSNSFTEKINLIASEVVVLKASDPELNYEPKQLQEGTRFSTNPANMYLGKPVHTAYEATERDIERFWSKVNKTGPCWEWMGRLKDNGYGVFIITSKNAAVAAHRFSYWLEHNEIGEGMVICHTCDNRKCVNPNHLFEGTIQDNTNDRITKGRNRNMQTGKLEEGLPQIERPDILTRRNELTELVKAGAEINRAELARKYGVSAVMIGKDLTWIEKGQ